jgi:hypothetical protein
MNTVLKEWCLVDVNDDGILIGSVLWGIVVDDSSCRYLTNDYVCTSKIINLYHQIITTNTGSIYQVIGSGSHLAIDYDDFELLRHGFSPNQVLALRMPNNVNIH